MTSAFITDRDGYLANFHPAAQAVFGLADTDADGWLSKDEFARFQRAFRTPEQDIEAAFNRLDANGSGALSVSELVDAAEQYYRGTEAAAHGNWLYGPIA
jgi:Ca2+-binding EF-hand superfamily protein